MNFLPEMEIADISNSYDDSYISIRVGDKLLPFQISSSFVDDDNRKKLMGYRWEKQGSELNAVQKQLFITNPGIELELPDFGNWRSERHGKMFYAVRQHRKQFRRGARLNRFNFYTLHSSGKSIEATLDQQAFSELIYDYLNNIVGEGVIDRDYCIVGDLVFFRAIPIGLIDRKTKGINFKLKPPQLDIDNKLRGIL